MDGYRFGFNGKENDNEVKGIGNSIDFGDRIYDPRLGRWLSIDPLQKKYPYLSPYIFAGNNPIKFVDYDGKDFGVHVNHDTKTIIVSATFYSTKADAASAQKAANNWNKESGEYEYTIDGQKYNVQFNVSVKIVEGDYSDRADALEKDKSGMANQYAIVPEDAYPEHGQTERGKDVTAKASAENRETGAHEMGHTFGLGHWTKGLMKRGEDRLNSETKITKGMVTQILHQAGLVKGPINRGMDREMDAVKTQPNVEVSSECAPPANFDQGKVSKTDKTP